MSEVECWSPWIQQSTWPIATKRPCWSINRPTGGTTANIGRDQLVQGLLSSTVQLKLMKEITPDMKMSVIMVRQWHPAVLRSLSTARSGLAALTVQQLRKQAQETDRMVEDLRRQIEELNGQLFGKGKTIMADQLHQSSAFPRKQGSAAITSWNYGE